TLHTMDLRGHVVGVQPLDPATEEALRQTVEARGGMVRLVAPTTTVDPEATELLSRISEGSVHGICFLTERTSSWLFDACRASGQEDRLTKVLRTIPVIATSPVSTLLRKCGVHPDYILSDA